jgi:hypothetical protein
MTKHILLVFMVSLIAFANAQETNPKKPCFRVSSFSSSIGFGGAHTSNSDADYYALKNAVENPDLFVDITGMDQGSSGWSFDGMYYTDGFYSGGSGNGNLLFNLGLTPYCKKKGKYLENRELRISIGGSLGARNSFYYSDLHTFVIDTFQSVNGNEAIYADSVIRNDYYYTLDYTDVSIGLSYLFKTDVERRVHFYTGIGVNYGIALRSTVSVDEENYRSVYYYNVYDKPTEDDINYFLMINDNGHTYDLSTTNLKSPMQFVRAYIPLSVNLRLSKKPQSFFSDVDLYTELSPGVEFQILSSEKTYVNPYFGMAFIGFRYKF